MKVLHCLIAIFLYSYLYKVVIVINVIICEVDACNLSWKNRKIESLTVGKRLRIYTIVVFFFVRTFAP